MSFIYSVPKDCKLIVVADLFEKQYVGGAELTLSAIIEDSPHKYFEINSQFITVDFIEKHKNLYWLIGNCANLSKDAIITLVLEKVKYSLIQCDQWFCKYRSLYLHNQRENKNCDCNTQEHGKLVFGFFRSAQHVFFMSSEQKKMFIKQFPKMATWSEEKLLVQGSTFSEEHLNKLTELFKNKKGDNGKYAIQKGASWIKNEQGCVNFCKQNNINYELIGNIPPNQFLETLSEYRGLVAMPLDFDTAPRIVLEAAQLGLELVLNDNVQIKNESYLKLSPLELIDFHKKKKNFIWEKIEIV